MTITTLHDAARQLEEIYAQVERILDDAEPLEEAHHSAVAEASAIVEGLLDDETEQELAAASGFGPYVEVVCRLREMLGCVERDLCAAHVVEFGRYGHGGDR